MKKTILPLLIIAFCTIEVSDTTAWENKLTHPAITKQAVNRSVLAGDYLEKQLGLVDGLDTELELTDEFKNNIDMRVGQEPEFNWNKTKISILDWLKDGSSLEDVPNPRARHHFHDPIRDAGLDNSNGPAWLMNLLYFGSHFKYPNYLEFTADGISALDTARGTHFWSEPSPVYRNLCDWPHARELFYDAVTKPSKSDREKNLGSMFVVVGHICHLIEDMGVPAHVRNDFIWGHAVAGFHKNTTGAQNPWYKGGNPFEAWMETQIANDGDEIPSAYLTRLMDVPPAFSKLERYWDSGICELSGVTQWQGDSLGWPSTGFGNPPPEKSWGLSECSNYQLLSYSTIFKENDNIMYQSFPHPAKEHTRVDWYPTGPKGERQYYRLGYEVPHLARVTYTTFYAWLIPIYTIETSTTEEERVYEDYAKRTIPRTIDYTTGLINYFFRGRLQLRNSVSFEGGYPLFVKLYITNKSLLEASSSDYQFALKGGQFEVYWDGADGERHQLQDFTMSREWNAESILEYDEEMWIEFDDTIEENLMNAERFIVVYRGNVVKQPECTIDEDDTTAIAVGTVQAIFCPSCPGKIPKNIQVVFSGITSCGCHRDDSYSQELIGNFNVTRTLPYAALIVQDGNEYCVWTEWYKETNPIPVIYREYYGNEDCTGSNICDNILEGYPVVYRQGDIIDVYIICKRSFFKTFLYEDTFLGNDCVGGTYQNSSDGLEDCRTIDPLGWYILAYDGQCIVTELW